MKRRSLRPMDGGARNWLGSQVRKNYWRVAHWMDPDDLVQDGCMCWQICRMQYPNANTRQFMALFKTTFTNHIHRLANKRTASITEVEVDEVPDTCDHDECSDGELRLFVAEAPPELRAVLTAMLDNPDLLNRPVRRFLDGRRQTTNSWLASFAGIDPSKVDIADQLREFLGINEA